MEGNSKNIWIAVIGVVILLGCSGREERGERSTAEVVYDKAKNSMEGGSYRNAANYLEILVSSFPFSNQSKQAQLDLIYAYYRSGDFESAVDEARQFEKENPTHPRVDYALYMRGLSLFEGQHKFYHDFFNVDLTKRPPAKTEESFSVFAQLIRRYPNSIYVEDAKQRMIFLRNRLAKYENHVASHYMERGAYVAAINRAKYSIEQYNGAPATVESLRIIAESYEKLGMTDLADTAGEIYLANIDQDISETTSLEEKKPWYKFW